MENAAYKTRRSLRGDSAMVSNDEGNRKSKRAASGRAVLGDVSNRGRKGSENNNNALQKAKITKPTAKKASVTTTDGKTAAANVTRGRKAATKTKPSAVGAKPKVSRGTSDNREKTTKTSAAKPTYDSSKRGPKRASDSGKTDGDGRSAKRKRSSGTVKGKRPVSLRTVATRTRSSTQAVTRESIQNSFGGEEDEKREDAVAIVRRDNCIVPPDFRLKRGSFDGKNHTYGIAHYDAPNISNPLLCVDYVTDMFQHFYRNESFSQPEMYMDSQDGINATMRAILVDWLIEVHMKFRLAPETLYLCVNILDRYCSRINVRRSKLQLIGITTLLVACKHEETYPPEVRDCVYITDRAYGRQEVLDMEQSILTELNWKLSVPTAYPFLHRYLSMVDASPLTKHAAAFYMERTLQEHDMLRYRPSLVCLATVILALNNPDIRLREQNLDRVLPGLPKILMEYTEFRESEVLNIVKLVAKKVGEEPITASRRQLIAVKRKYENETYMGVSSKVELPSHLHVIANMHSDGHE